MKKTELAQSGATVAEDKPAQVLGSLEKAASAIIRQVKQMRATEDGAGDAVGAHQALKDLREQLEALAKFRVELAEQDADYLNRADKQFLELESAIREGCRKREWRLDGQWPTLYAERAVAIEASEANRSVTVSGKKTGAPTADSVVKALKSILPALLPRAFSPKEFMRDLAAAYDSIRGSSTQLQIFDLYRGLVVQSQGARFWRDARAEAFSGLSADQFRARLTAALESGVVTAPDGRGLRLLPPLNPKEGLFMYQPAESRYGFVGRVEFMPAGPPEAP